LKYFGKRDEGQLKFRHIPKFLYWAYEYDKKDRIKHQYFIRKYKKKFVILKNDTEAKKYLENS